MTISLCDKSRRSQLRTNRSATAMVAKQHQCCTTQRLHGPSPSVRRPVLVGYVNSRLPVRRPASAPTEMGADFALEPDMRPRSVPARDIFLSYPSTPVPAHLRPRRPASEVSRSDCTVRLYLSVPDAAVSVPDAVVNYHQQTRRETLLYYVASEYCGSCFLKGRKLGCRG